MTTRELPRVEPREITAGETPRWRKTLRDFPASEGWALNYYFRGPSAGFGVACTADGDDFVAAVADGDTDALPPGTYYWQAWATKGAEEYQVASGSARVVMGYQFVTANTPVDERSTVKKILDAIDALVRGKATRDQQEYRIGTGDSMRMLQRIPPSELIQLRREYARLYAAERRAARVRRGGTLFSTVKVRFNRPR